MLERDDLREYIVKDGKKVLKHGYWEYLHDNGALASKGKALIRYELFSF